MTLVSILALAGAMLLLAITPGPGVFATVARSLASGMKHSAFVVLGIVTGDLIFLLFAIFGLATVAENLHGLFVVIKYIGAAYLIYLGVKLWFSRPEEIQINAAEDDRSWTSNFMAGLFITLGNPKVILFYLGFLPTFVDLTVLNGLNILVIATVVTFVLGSTMLAYAYAASKVKTLFQNPKSQRWMNRTGGAVMITTGSILAVKA